MPRFGLLVLATAFSAALCSVNDIGQAVLLSSASWSYENCGLPTDIVQIQSIQISPDPPQPGSNLTVTVRGSVSDRIEEGAYADVTVKLGLIKLLARKIDICEEARNGNSSLQCPVEKGTYTVEETVALPVEIPRATFNIDCVGYTADDVDMLCLKFKVDFGPWCDM